MPISSSPADMLDFPAVTILKPLKGLDRQTYENLETYFNMNYPACCYEVVFCIQDVHDPVVDLVRSLVERYPNVPAKISIDSRTFNVNPKLNNVIHEYEKSLAELVWISDSGTPATQNLLREFVMAFRRESKIGILHQLPTLVLGREAWFGDRIEDVHFGTTHAKYYFILNALGFNCVNGMSILFSKSTMESIGGLRQFGRYLGEDYYMGKAMVENGYQVCVAPAPARQRLPSRSVFDVYNRHLRWARLRRKMMLSSAIAEPSLQCFPTGLVLVFALQGTSFATGSLDEAFCFFWIHTILWILVDMILYTNATGHWIQFHYLPKWLTSWLVREVGSIIISIHGGMSNVVSWRDNSFELLSDGLCRQL